MVINPLHVRAYIEFFDESNGKTYLSARPARASVLVTGAGTSPGRLARRCPYRYDSPGRSAIFKPGGPPGGVPRDWRVARSSKGQTRREAGAQSRGPTGHTP